MANILLRAFLSCKIAFSVGKLAIVVMGCVGLSQPA